MTVMVLTGGSRGIGAAVAHRAVRAGYAVCFSYSTDHARAEATLNSLKATGGLACAVHADVSDPAAAPLLFDTAEKAFGPVTAVVHNAGVTGRIGPLAAATVADMRRVVDVNAFGALLICQQAVRRWQQQNVPGVVVNVTSAAATSGAPHEYVAYAASKAAIEALTVGLGREVARHSIRINAVAPGTVYTDIHAAAGEPNRPARVAAKVPMGRIGEPDEIANAVMWLISDASSYVTACVLRVSGGL